MINLKKTRRDKILEKIESNKKFRFQAKSLKHENEIETFKVNPNTKMLERRYYTEDINGNIIKIKYGMPYKILMYNKKTNSIKFLLEEQTSKERFEAKELKLLLTGYII